jgi:hypothetical protein
MIGIGSSEKEFGMSDTAITENAYDDGDPNSVIIVTFQSDTSREAKERTVAELGCEFGALDASKYPCIVKVPVGCTPRQIVLRFSGREEVLLAQLNEIVATLP